MRAEQATLLKRAHLPWQSLRLARSLALFARAKPLGAVGALILIVAFLAAVFAPWVAPHDPLRVDTDRILVPPGGELLLGSDFLGRDVLSRVIFGARISLYVAVGSMTISLVVGALLGGVGAYLGGNSDMVIQRVMDAMMAFPSLVLALALMASLGPTLNNVVLAIAIVYTPRTARVIRSAVLAVKGNQYIDAAHAIGCSTARILWRHIAPNCVAPAIVIATVNLGVAITAEGSLSFIGAGVPPPTPSWGNMVAGAAIEMAQKAPYLPLFPGITLTLTVLGFNIFGDALRDLLDPRLRVR
ncbi:MAG: ABC transporter permease [Chloroflexi bacterium]|nr:ABC transporter permease [Chloroflexota bacterium]